MISWNLAVFVLVFLCSSQVASHPSREELTPQRAGQGPGNKAHVNVEPGDLVLDVSNFHQAVAKYEKSGLFVEFFLPWCGHSRRLRPELKRAAASLGGLVLFARVDCSNPRGAPLCAEHEIAYHPTLIMFSRGHQYEYTKRGTHSELTRYARMMMQSTVRVVDRILEVSRILESEPIVVIGFHREDQALDDFFHSVAESLQDQLTFLSISNPKLLEAFAVTHTPSYVVMRQGFDSVEYQPKRDTKANENPATSFGLWMAEVSINLVETLTQENYSNKLGNGLPALILFVDNTIASKNALKAMYRSARTFMGKVMFCQIDGRRYQSLTLRLGVKPGVLPSVAIVDLEAQAHYILPSYMLITPETVTQFANNYTQGKLQPSLRSAAEPLWEAGPVYTLVADTFERDVIKSNKDVMVNFGTKWCGFCNVLVPVYEAVAKDTANIGSLILYNFDLGDNDPQPSLNVTASPTLMLFPAHNKTAIPFVGERTVAAITKFLREHVSVKFEEIGNGELISADGAEKVAQTIKSVRNVYRPT